MIRVSALLLAVSLLSSSPSSAATEKERSDALALYRQGSALYETGQYHEAIRLFKRSLGVYGHPNTLYALGEAFRRLGMLRQSHHYYSRYAATLKGEERDVFQRKLARMLAESRSDISITTEPPGATVTVDGEIRGSTPPRGALKIAVAAGQHSINARLAGHSSASVAVVAQFAEPLELRLRLKPVSRRRPPRAPPAARQDADVAFVDLQAGIAFLDYGDDRLDVSPSFLVGLEGGALLLRRGALGMTAGVSLFFIGVKDGNIDDQAAFINLVLHVGGRLHLGPRIWLELRLGVGPSFLVGAEPGSFLYQRGSGAVEAATGLVIRPEVCAVWKIYRGVTLQLHPFALDYSPRLGGFAELSPSIGDIKRYHAGLGLGWHFGR
jgi:hypothetical protein